MVINYSIGPVVLHHFYANERDFFHILWLQELALSEEEKFAVEDLFGMTVWRD